MKVYYGKNFWGKSKNGKEMEHIKLNRDFQWEDLSGFIPAAYIGDEGIAVDICIAVSNEAVFRFYNKWKEKIKLGLSETEQQQLILENPMALNVGIKLSVNGNELQNDFGCSACYSGIMEFMERELQHIENDLEVWEELQEYGCDENQAWVFWRHMCRWEEKPAKLKHLEVNLIAGYQTYAGEAFSVSVDDIGKQYELFHPINKKRYLLRVVDAKQESIDKEIFRDQGRSKQHIEYPNHYITLAYEIEPDLPKENFRLQDMSNGDTPRNMQINENSTASIIIGNADGPTSVFLAGKINADRQTAVSALYFEEQNSIFWKPVFLEKERQDILISIHLP